MNRFAKFWYKERAIGTYMILFAIVISVTITVFNEFGDHIRDIMRLHQLMES